MDVQLGTLPLPKFAGPSVSLDLPRIDPSQPSLPSPAGLPRMDGPSKPAQAGSKKAPEIGTTINGYTYMGGDPRSEDPSVWRPATGDTFLNSLPIDANKKAIVKAIANYDLPPGSQRGGLGSPEVQQLLGLAKQYDPDFSASDYSNRQQTRQAFLKGDYSKSITALSTAIDHARALADAGARLNNSGSPMWNMVANAFDQYAMGDPRQSNYKQIAQMEAGEVVKAVTGGNGTLEDRKDAVSNYPLNGSPAQQREAIATTVGLLKSKLDELNGTYQRGMGRQHSVMDLLSPSARRSWEALTKQYGVEDPSGHSATKPPPNAHSGPSPQDIVNELRRRGVVQ
jgi:hypothetical protein